MYCVLILFLLHTAAGFKIGHRNTSAGQHSIGWNIPTEKLPLQIRQKALIHFLMKGIRRGPNSSGDDEDYVDQDVSDTAWKNDDPILEECLWLVTKNASGILTGKDHCVCEIVLPDKTFPVQRVAALEDETQRLGNQVEDEMEKIEEQEIRLESYLDKLINFTLRLERLEKMRPEELVDINFGLLRKDLQEMERLVIELKAKLKGNASHVENLYTEVKNISKIVGLLETMDKNNVLKAQRDMEMLKKKILDCEKNLKAIKTPVTIPLGSCQHRGLARIGKPNIIQVNWKGVGFKSGAWGKDAAWNTTRKLMYWVAPLNINGRILESVRVYSNLYDMQLNRSALDVPLAMFMKNKLNYTIAGQGSGMIVHNNHLYYNCYNSRDMCRINLSSFVTQRKTLLNAVFNNRYSYAGVSFQDIDFASDERGLWVLYTTEENAGKLVIGKVNVATFNIDNSWPTTQFKPEVSNAFMICGVLYATRSISPKQEEVFYTFDTKTGKEVRVSIIMDKISEKVQSLSYNSNDRKLYMFTEGVLVSYDVALKA